MTINSLEDLVDQQAERIKELEEIARKWELAAKTARKKLETLGALLDRKPTESVEMVVERTNARIKELEGLLAPSAKTIHDLIQQNSAVVLDARNLRSAIGTMVPSICRVLLKLLPADAEVDRQMTEAVLKRIETAMTATEKYCAVQETVIIENATIQLEGSKTS